MMVPLQVDVFDASQNLLADKTTDFVCEPLPLDVAEEATITN